MRLPKTTGALPGIRFEETAPGYFEVLKEEAVVGVVLFKDPGDMMWLAIDLGVRVSPAYCGRTRTDAVIKMLSGR
jgi:hypothetical protein